MAQYGKSWGSVSSDFRKTTGFQSETARISKQAEDQYRKEKDQLSSMKQVAAFDARQARTSAAMADKASAYELKALEKFSSKLQTFINGPLLEHHKEQDAQDIKDKIEKRKKNVVEHNTERAKLEDAIAASSENATRVAELQEELKAHNLLDPNSEKNVARLSGNELIAYQSIKADSIISNVPASYNNWKEETKDDSVVATWLPEETVVVNGQERKRHRVLKHSEITTVEGKEFLKDKYLTKLLKDNPMAGLKATHRAELFGDPVKAELDKIHANEVQRIKQANAEANYDARKIALRNRIQGKPGYESMECDRSKPGGCKRDAEFNAMYAAINTSYIDAGKGNHSDGLDDMFTSMMEAVTESPDKESMTKAMNRLLEMGNVRLETGPHKGKLVKDALKNRFNPEEITRQTAKKIGQLDSKVKAEYEGRAQLDVTKYENDISRRKNLDPKDKEYLSPEAADAAMDEHWATMYEKYKNHPHALLKLHQLKGDSTVTHTEDDWEDVFVNLGDLHRGVIPKHLLKGMPDDLSNSFSKKYGWEIVDQIPGHASPSEKALSKIHTETTLKKAIIDAERRHNQPNRDENTDVMIDLAGDHYQKLVNQYIMSGDPETGEKLRPREAQIKAMQTVKSMIDSDDKFLKDGVTPNPFYSSNADTTKGRASAWDLNPELNRHLARGQRLWAPNERQWMIADENINNIRNKEDRKVVADKDFLFEVNVNKETFQVDPKSPLVKILGDGNSNPGSIMSITYNKLSKENVGSYTDFIHKQRIALLKKTSPTGDAKQSTLWTDRPELMASWFKDTKTQENRTAYMANEGPGVAERGLAQDYGGRGRDRLSQSDAEKMISGEGVETVFEKPNRRGR